MAANGAIASRMGLAGIPAAAETIALQTLLELLRAFGAGHAGSPRVHICRLSSAKGVALLRQAKAEGLNIVFATRSPHRPNHLGLSLLKLERIETGKPVRLYCSGADLLDGTDDRSEKRRVGKECRSRWSPYH